MQGEQAKHMLWTYLPECLPDPQSFHVKTSVSLISKEAEILAATSLLTEGETGAAVSCE